MRIFGWGASPSEHLSGLRSTLSRKAERFSFLKVTARETDGTNGGEKGVRRRSGTYQQLVRGASAGGGVHGEMRGELDGVGSGDQDVVDEWC